MNDPTKHLLANDYFSSPGLLKVQSTDMITLGRKLYASMFYNYFKITSKIKIMN
jgi:hypothetical protein